MQTGDDSGCFPNPMASMSPDGSMASFGTECGRPWNSTTGALTNIGDVAAGQVVQTLPMDPPVVFSWQDDRFVTGDTVWCR